MVEELKKVCTEFHDLREIFECTKEKCTHIAVKELGIQTTTGCIVRCVNPNCNEMIECTCPTSTAGKNCGAFCLQASCPNWLMFRPVHIERCDFSIETRSCSKTCGNEEMPRLVVPFEERYKKLLKQESIENYLIYNWLNIIGKQMLWIENQCCELSCEILSNEIYERRIYEI